MGTVCKSQNSSSTLIQNSKNNLSNSSPILQQAECSLKLIDQAKPNKQSAIQAFTYKLSDHLDSFNEEFFKKSYQIENQIEVSLKDVKFRNSSNLLIITDQPTFSPKLVSIRLTRTQADPGTQNKRRRKQYDQVRRSQEVVRNFAPKSILKITSKSFDSIQTKKKQVRFGRVSFQFKVPVINRYK